LFCLFRGQFFYNNIIHGETITLDKDLVITTEKPLLIKKSCTYDGKNHTITFKDKALLLIDGPDDTTVTFKNITLLNIKSDENFSSINFGSSKNQTIELEMVTIQMTSDVTFNAEKITLLGHFYIENVKGTGTHTFTYIIPKEFLKHKSPIIHTKTDNYKEIWKD